MLESSLIEIFECAPVSNWTLRLPPVLRMQRIQQFAHARISRATGSGRPVIPSPVRVLLQAFRPLVRRVMARVIGRGFLPEHVESD